MPPQAPSDAARASEIVKQLRTGIEKYKDYHAALNDGYKIFLPNLPQPEYHFTNYWNGFLEAFAFDPARPTSLLYKKTSEDRKSTRLNSSHSQISYAVFCLKRKYRSHRPKLR